MKNKTSDKVIASLSVVIIIMSSVILGLVLFWDRAVPIAPSNLATSPRKTYLFQNSLNGAGEDINSEGGGQVVAIMIDNHPDARPEQAGLSQARVVYEAPVEGGLTRLMALFSASDALRAVGPVRSARPYFIDWASEYGAFYLHSGGSPEALSLLKSNPALVHDADEFGKGQYFWRADKIKPPHNLFTSGEIWQKLIARENTPFNTWRQWQFETVRSVDPHILEPTVATSSTVPVNKGISLSYNKNFEVVWQYDATSSLFQRVVNNVPAKDESGQEITAMTIIIQKTNIKTIDSEGRKKISTLGEGEASIISLGKKLDGRWRKVASGRTLFYTNGGAEIIFAAGPARNASDSDAGGPIWVEVVPAELAPKIME